MRMIVWKGVRVILYSLYGYESLPRSFSKLVRSTMARVAKVADMDNELFSDRDLVGFG